MEKKQLFRGVILGILSLLTTVQIFSQDNLTFAKEGLGWKIHLVSFKEDTVVTYTIKGDTILNCVNYKKLVDAAGKYWNCVRQDGGKVYFHEQKTDNPNPLNYDFDLEIGDCYYPYYIPGDSVWQNSDTYYRVSRIDTVEAHGREYKRMYLDLEVYDGMKYPKTTIWVDGIGSPDYIMNMIPGLNATNGFTPKVLEVTDNGEVIFSYNDFFTSRKGYHPFVENGKEWTIFHFSPNRNEQYTYKMKLVRTADKDSLSHYALVRDESPEYLGIFSEDNEEVTYSRENLTPANDEVCIYDFTVCKGTKFYDAVKGDTLTVDSVVYRKICKDVRRIAYLTCTSGNHMGYSTKWIDGIGTDIRPDFAGVVPDGEYDRLYCCTVNGDTIYHDTDLDQFVLSGVKAIAADPFDVAEPVYDLSGRRLLSAPRQGIYIKGKKKYMAK